MDFAYDRGLVALSVAAVILGAFTGLVMTSGVRQARGLEAAMRILLGGLALGGGIWAMHFIAMLAIVLPIRLTYSVSHTLTSAGVIIGCAIIALWMVATRMLGHGTLLISALFLGAAMIGMHFYGLAAIRGCGVHYSGLGIGICLLIALQASAVALWFAFRKRGVADTLLGALALGLAIAAMHYSSMEAARFLLLDSADGNQGAVLNERLLAISVGVTLYSICSICLLVFALLAFSRRPVRL